MTGRRCVPRLMVVLLAGLAGLLLAPIGSAQQPAQQPALQPGQDPEGTRPAVLSARVDGAITPPVATYLTDGLRAAERGGYQAFLVELDTPGGLDASMREIIQQFLNARVPVVVYVTPSGARAASAGALITLSAHVAAMAPGTSIGAATPVDAGGGEVSQKIVQDSAAYAASVAAQRNRDAGLAGDMVRDGVAVPAQEARELDAVDLVVADRAALLTELDGREVTLDPRTTVVLSTAGAAVTEYQFGWVRQAMNFLADPNVAFLLLSVGTLALIYELVSPGVGVGGITGAILLILGFFALAVLPVTATGIALLLLAAALFAAELFAPGIGVFAAGGAVALVLSGFFLFDGPDGVSPGVLYPTALIVGAGSLVAGRLALRARGRQPVFGPEALIGKPAVISQTSGPSTGRVQLEGTSWSARSSGAPLHEGQQVRVVALDGLTVVVEPIPSDEEVPP